MPPLAEAYRPALFALLCRYGLHLPADLALVWWGGLAASDDPQCRWLVRKVLGYGASPEAFCRWVVRTVPPRRLVETAEALCTEGALTRHQATAIEESLFQAMNATTWK